MDSSPERSVSFTAADMDLLTEVAARCFKSQRWVAVARRTEPQGNDALVVALADGGWPSVTIERLDDGTYQVRDPDGGIVALGSDLRTVLMSWDSKLDLP